MERLGDNDHPLNRIISRRAFLRKMIGLSEEEGGPSLLNTIATSGAISLGLAATTPLAVKIEESSELTIGNSQQARRMGAKLKDEEPVQLLLIGALIAPVFEEGLFRILPGVFLPKSWGTAWRIGIPSSAIFAEVHALEIEEQSNKIKLATNTIPVYQFGLGLYLWKLVRERGPLHALVAHSVINAVQMTLFLSGFIEKMNGSPTPKSSELPEEFGFGSVADY